MNLINRYNQIMSVLKRTLLLSSNNNNTRRLVFKLIRRALSSSTSASTSPSLSTTTIDINSVYEPIDIQNTLIEERIFSKFDKFANKIALVCKTKQKKTHTIEIICYLSDTLT